MAIVIDLGIQCPPIGIAEALKVEWWESQRDTSINTELLDKLNRLKRSPIPKD